MRTVYVTLWYLQNENEFSLVEFIYKALQDLCVTPPPKKKLSYCKKEYAFFFTIILHWCHDDS